MLWFILGTMCGGFFGVFIMCLMNITEKSNDISTKE